MLLALQHAQAQDDRNVVVSKKRALSPLRALAPLRRPLKAFALPHMQVVEFGDLLGLLRGVEQELARFDAAPEAVIQERIAASEAILQTYSLEAELECCLRTWAHICP